MDLAHKTRLTTSVVVPVYNAGESLIRLLDALAMQSRIPDEIVMVDDGSTDCSGDIARQWHHRHPEILLQVIQQANQGPAAARNRGTHQATGDLVVFIDSDCIPLSDWLEKMAAPFADPEVVGVQGAYRCNQPEWIAQFSQLEIEERYTRMLRSPSIDFIGTYAAAYRRQIFFEKGGFDTRFPMASGEDAEFSFRLADHGLRMVFAPEAFVYHSHPDTLKRYLRQKYWRAYWRNLIYRQHFSRMWKDSYTPNTLKIQTLLGMLFFPSLAAIPLASWGWMVPVGILAAIFALTLPFTFWVAKQSRTIAMGSPLILFLRSFVLAIGAAHGFFMGLWVRKEYDGVQTPQA